MLWAAGCMADDTPPSCDAIPLAGPWAVAYGRDPDNPGDCPGDRGNDTLTFEADGSFSSEIFGGPCKTKLEGCYVTGTCTTKPLGATTTLRVSFKFIGRGVSGALIAGVVYDTGESCTANMKLSGQRN
jgi:hypothetical protein